MSLLDTFVEISPLDVEIDSSSQRELAPEPLEKVDFPKNCIYGS